MKLDANWYEKYQIPFDRVQLATQEGTLSCFVSAIEEDKKESNIFRPCEVGIIGAGDFGIALAKSFKPNINILFYDFESVRNIFSQCTRITTNRNFAEHLGGNIDFTSDLRKVLDAKFIILAVPANVIPHMIDKIKQELPVTYKEKQYVLVSKGFIGKGYIPHRWLERNGIPFEQIIWASGGNVAKDVVAKKSFNISVVSINKNKKQRREFVSFFNKEYLNPVEYSGSALLACELGGILKNYYAGLGRYIWLKHGESMLLKYKRLARREFRRSVRIVASAPNVSIRAWVIRKASHGPAFWEDLDVTIRDGRNGIFGEQVFNGVPVKKTLDNLGLVESFKTVFSTLSLFNRLSKHSFNRLPMLKAILDVYEELHIQLLDEGDAHISNESKLLLSVTEDKILKEKLFFDRIMEVIAK